MSDIFTRLTRNRHAELALRILTVLGLLFLFLVGVKGLSEGLSMMGNGFAKTLFGLTENPMMALMAGMLATVLFQSSSVTTSIIVGLVAAGTISVGGAVPMIMGANLGTSLTNTLVSLGFIKNRTNFQRAFAAATVHDFFNILTVIVLLPIELATGFIEKSATALAKVLYGTTMGLDYSSPIKTAIKPLVGFFKHFTLQHFTADVAPYLMMAIAGFIIVTTLGLIVRTMSHYIEENENHLIETILAKNSYVTAVIGVLVTISVQSSSITTSLLIPLAGTGMLTLNTVYAVSVGANIGTTVTALIAALTGNMAGLAIALVHLLFNLLGTLIFFMHPFMRRFPISCAEALASSIQRTKFIGIGYVGIVFFCLPISLIFLFR